MEVKLSVSVANKAAPQARESCSSASRGIKRRLPRSNLQRRFGHEEKITMSTKIAMELVAVVMALAFPALAAGNGNRDNAYAYTSAQYCVPQYDDLPDLTRVYCWAQRRDNKGAEMYW